MENEVWKDVNFEHWGEIYQVSNLGRVRSKDRCYTAIHPMTKSPKVFHIKSKYLKSHKNNCGYETISFGTNRKHFFVHRLVLITFSEVPLDITLEVNHKDGNKSNNKINNLEWVTSKENIRHALDNKLIVRKKGEFHAQSKKIMQMDKNSGEIIKIWGCVNSIQRELNYHQSNICEVARGNTKRKTAYGFKWKYI
jgi:hypothetical protein